MPLIDPLRFAMRASVRTSEMRVCLTLLPVSLAALLGASFAFSSATAQQPAPASPLVQPQPAPVVPPAPAVRVQPRFVVVLDAAHGGADTGARLGGQMLEKDLVLTLSVRLRSMLNARGIPVVTTRESDSSIPVLDRAEIANHAVSAACLSLHATSSGSGVHLFTSSITPAPAARFLPWDTAQGAYTERSLRLSSEISTAMAHAQVPVTLGRTALEPLDSFACPAVALEVAPLTGSGAPTQLSDSDYETRLVSAIAAALQQWQRDWRLQP